MAFGRLEARVWSQRDINIRTKLGVYESCVITTLLFATETWTTHQRHVRSLERFHHNCLRRLPRISWKSMTPDTEVLERAESLSIRTRLIKIRLRWSGHVSRLDDCRLPKQVFYGELMDHKRPQHKPKKRYKDCLKNDLKDMKIDITNWDKLAADRAAWRKEIYDKGGRLEAEGNSHAKMVRAARKMEDIDLPPGRGTKKDLTCQYCARILLSKAGLVNHLKSHDRNPGLLSCPICNQACRSKSGLTRHINIAHTMDADNQRVDVASPHTCMICNRICKSAAGLKSHIRAHEREAQN